MVQDQVDRAWRPIKHAKGAAHESENRADQQGEKRRLFEERGQRLHEAE